jgi:hypothetical protein
MPRRAATASKGVELRTPRTHATALAGADSPGNLRAGRSFQPAYTSAGMVMVGHSQRLAQPLTRGQHRLIALVVVLVLAGASWAIVRPSSAPVSRNGCVNVVVASSMGGGLLQHCGAAARSWCQAEFARSDVLARLIQTQCRRAGLQPRRT